MQTGSYCANCLRTGRTAVRIGQIRHDMSDSDFWEYDHESCLDAVNFLEEIKRAGNTQAAQDAVWNGRGMQRLVAADDIDNIILLITSQAW
jgi:hypothetical protein